MGKNQDKVDELLKKLHVLEERTAQQEKQISKLTREIFTLIENSNSIRTFLTKIIYEEDISRSMAYKCKEMIQVIEGQLHEQDKLMQFILNLKRNKVERGK